jgi:hypothetical protein
MAVGPKDIMTYLSWPLSHIQLHFYQTKHISIKVYNNEYHMILVVLKTLVNIKMPPIYCQVVASLKNSAESCILLLLRSNQWHKR